MQLPFFYIDPRISGSSVIELDEENSRHAVQVLRMKTGDLLHLTDGEGSLFTARVQEGHKKHCRVEILESKKPDPPLRKISIGISLLKNANRFEWFLEKATEMGVTRIIPLICQRTEKEKFRTDRMRNLCVSAMLQSRQLWLPRLEEPTAVEVLLDSVDEEQRYIAFCGEDERRPLASLAPFAHAITLIGPEGDFTEEEIARSARAKFIPVSLGNTRLRSETAGMVAAAIMVNA